jgi:hypothetical protein
MSDNPQSTQHERIFKELEKFLNLPVVAKN